MSNFKWFWKCKYNMFWMKLARFCVSRVLWSVKPNYFTEIADEITDKMDLCEYKERFEK